MKNILLVDDDSELLEALELIIGEHSPDYTVFTAKDGEDAFFKCVGGKFDLIITDQKMPNMTGVEFITAIKTRPNENKDTPIIMLSGFLNKDIEAELNKKKIAFAGKPFENDDLLKLVSEYV